jgi:hypothetical protein
MRHVATITVYSFGDDDKTSFQQAQKMVEMLNKNFDGCNANVEGFAKQEFGTIGSTALEIDNLK